MKTINTLVLSILLLFTSSISAQVISDRPDQTESSSTISKGSLQIESGLLYGTSEEDEMVYRQFQGPTTLFRYGITNGIELRVQNQFESIKNQTIPEQFSGMSDLEIGAKIQLLKKEGLNTEIAILSHVSLPTGSTGLSNDKVASLNRISVSHNIADFASIGYNVGYNYFGTGIGDILYTVAIGFGINEKVGVYFEAFGDIVEMEENMSSFDSGITYLVKDNLQLDFSFGTGITHSMNYISMGVAWHLPHQQKEVKTE